MIKQIKNGIIFGISAGLSMLMIGISYAVWNNLSTVSNGSDLTADIWNEVINTVNIFGTESQEKDDSFAHLGFNVAQNVTVAGGEKIPFDKLWYGNPSLLSNGEYTAPSSGYYFVSLGIYYITDNNARVYIKVNGTFKSLVQMQGNGGTRFLDTNTIIYLNQGDKLYAEVLDNASYADLTMGTWSEHTYMRIMRIK